jgi:hypothetical protein
VTVAQADRSGLYASSLKPHAAHTLSMITQSIAKENQSHAPF